MVTRNPRLRTIVIVLTAVLLTAPVSGCCNTRESPIASPTPHSEKITIEDKGIICFQKIQPSDNKITVYISTHPDDGCFSSSCTEVVERKGDMQVNEQDLSIHFYSRFVVRPIGYDELTPETPGEVPVCTTDCGGAGFIWFEIEALPEGVYSIWLGENRVGDLEVPIDPTKLTCFEWQ